MGATEGAIWFVGDLSDPWVMAIAGVIPRSAGLVQVHCPGELPDHLFEPGRPPRLVVLHRQRLTAADTQRLQRYRKDAAPNAALSIILCVGPYVRHEQVERGLGLADLVLSEATAADVLPRHVARLVERREAPRGEAAAAGFRIDVASGNYHLRLALVEACASGGYRAIPVDDLDPGYGASRFPLPALPGERVLTIWDVPVLEPEWPDRLERRARLSGPVITLIGFADRASVALARARGAIACLELPYNVDDLLDVIHRSTRSLPVEKWPMPARIEMPHRLPPRPRRRNAERDTPTAVPWSDHDRKPTIP
jgi:hypothetical protein